MKGTKNKILSIAILVLLIFNLISTNIFANAKDTENSDYSTVNLVVFRYINQDTNQNIKNEDLYPNGDIDNLKTNFPKQIDNYKLMNIKENLQGKTLYLDGYFKQGHFLIEKKIDIDQNQTFEKTVKTLYLEGENYTASNTKAKEGTNRKYVKSDKPLTGTMGKQDITINHYFKYTKCEITINFIDDISKNKIKSKTYYGEVGESINENLENALDYKYVVLEGQEVPKFSLKDQSININCKKRCHLRVKFINETDENNPVIDEKFYDGLEGYTIKINDSQVDSTMTLLSGPNTNEYTFSKTDDYIEYRYRKASCNLEINHYAVDYDNSNIDVEIGEKTKKIELNSKDINKTNPSIINYNTIIKNTGKDQATFKIEVTSKDNISYKINKSDDAKWEKVNDEKYIYTVENLKPGEERNIAFSGITDNGIRIWKIKYTYKNL